MATAPQGPKNTHGYPPQSAQQPPRPPPSYGSIPQAPGQAAPNLGFGYIPTTTQQNVCEKSGLVQPTTEQMDAILKQIVPALLFRDIPVITICPHCNQEIMTELEFVVGPATAVCCCMMIGCCLWAGCCLIPFCSNGLKDVIHSCPKCRFKIHKFKRGT